MRFVYLDHNVVTVLAEERAKSFLDKQYAALKSVLKTGKVTIVLSAVSLFEIAKSDRKAHVVACIELLEEITPQ